MKAYEVIIPQKAEEDLDAIYDYLLNISSSLNIAETFVTKLYSYIKNSLSFMPLRFPIYQNNIRKAVYSKNYIIFFEVCEMSSEVLIVAITNPKQFTRYSNLQ